MTSDALGEAELGKDAVRYSKSVLQELPLLVLIFEDRWQGLFITNEGEGRVS